MHFYGGMPNHRDPNKSWWRYFHKDSIHLVPLTTNTSTNEVTHKDLHFPKVFDLLRVDYLNSARQLISRDSLEVLFTSECLIVTSYLEAVIPIFYTTYYILVMVHLPSAKYHTETPENVRSTFLSVLVFGLLQIVSFVALVLVVQHNSNIRALHQLAFVLESQKLLIQSKLIVWMMITLCFRVSTSVRYNVLSEGAPMLMAYYM